VRGFGLCGVGGGGVWMVVWQGGALDTGCMVYTSEAQLQFGGPRGIGDSPCARWEEPFQFNINEASMAYKYWRERHFGSEVRTILRLPLSVLVCTLPSVKRYSHPRHPRNRLNLPTPSQAPSFNFPKKTPNPRSPPSSRNHYAQKSTDKTSPSLPPPVSH